MLAAVVQAAVGSAVGAAVVDAAAVVDVLGLHGPDGRSGIFRRIQKTT